MPDRGSSLSRNLRRLTAALAVATLCAGPALAVPDQLSRDMAAKLQQLDASLRDSEARTMPVDALIAASGLAAVVRPEDFAAPRPLPGAVQSFAAVEVQRMNMRLALTMLSQAYGSEDNADVLAAQPAADIDALVIRKGNVGISELRQILRDNRLQRVASDGPLELTVPLVIWSGASLQLRGADVLHLSRSDGAFIVNFGRLDIQGATIAVSGAENPASPDFIPFVTSADSGTVQVRDARISGLGFGNTLKFAGFAVMQSALRPAGDPNAIIDSRFDGVKSVAISNANGIRISGNHFRDMRSRALILSRSRNADVLTNLFSGAMPANAIVVEQGSVSSRIAGNIVLGGDRAGIVIRQDSSKARVTHNIVWGRDGGGISLTASDCGQVTENLVIDNDQKGIEVRDSRGAEVRDNRVLANHSAGIWVSDQPKGAQTLLSGNVLAGNGSGLAAAKGEQMRLEGNDFTGQFPQFLSGDLAPQGRLIANDLQGATAYVLTAAGRTDAGATPDTCAE